MSCMHRLKVESDSTEAPLRAQQGGGEEESSQWTELGAAHTFVHFAWKERWPEGKGGWHAPRGHGSAKLLPKLALYVSSFHLTDPELCAL